VLAENWQALELWHQFNGFWRFAGMGGIAGLDWAQIYHFSKLIGMNVASEDWHKLRWIESGFISEFYRA
jgi:hypothetical protein